MEVRGPTPIEEAAMLEAFIQDLEKPVFFDKNNTAHPLVCCVCDSITRTEVGWEWMEIHDFYAHCQNTNMTKSFLANVYPPALINQYTVPDVPILQSFVLSPASVYNDVDHTIALCELCANHMRGLKDVKKSRRMPPKEAIISAYLIGDAPKLLTDLNEVEVALLSTVRTSCQSWIYFAGCHQHIQGWHTFYENRPANNIANINNLADAGMKGQLLVVLCGPFTTTQIALARAQVLVNTDKVLAAFNWLKQNNYHYRDIVIPCADDLPIPQIVENGL